MKKVDLNFDYKSEGIDLKETDPKTVFPSLFQQLVDSSHQGGMQSKDLIMLYKVFTKFENPPEDMQVELEDAEYAFALKAVTEGRFTPQQMKVSHLIYKAFGLTE